MSEARNTGKSMNRHAKLGFLIDANSDGFSVLSEPRTLYRDVQGIEERFNLPPP